MAKTVKQLMEGAQKLINQAKELEKQQYSKIGEHVAKLYHDKKISDKNIILFIDKVFGNTIDITQSITNDTETITDESYQLETKNNTNIINNAKY